MKTEPTIAMVREFHEAFGVGRVNNENEHQIRRLRAELIREETRELFNAISVFDQVEALDGLCDLLYVTNGALLAFGFDSYFDTGDNWNVKAPQIGFINLHDASRMASITLERGFHPTIHAELSDLAMAIRSITSSWGFKAGACQLPISTIFDEAFAEVHRSNMSKLGEDGKPVLREDGKIMKGPNFSPPNLGQFFN
jgi:predicted HAD superfamily Cof-like phosphohydrolase